MLMVTTEILECCVSLYVIVSWILVCERKYIYFRLYHQYILL